MKTSLAIASLLCLASLAIGCAAPADAVESEGSSTSNLGASPLAGTWAPAEKSYRLSLGITGDYLLEACADADCSQTSSENGTWTADRYELRLTPTSETRVAKPVSRDFVFDLSEDHQKLVLETNGSLTLATGAPGAPPVPVHEVLELSRVNAGRGEVCGPDGHCGF